MIRHVLGIAAVLAVTAPASAQANRFLDRDRAAWEKDLNDNDPAVRRGAAFALGKIGNERSIDNGLARALDDQDATVRAAAAAAIGDIVSQPGQGTANSWRLANRKLLDRLLNADEDPRVRRSAAYALGSFGPEADRAASELRRALKEAKVGPVRQNIAWAIGRLGDRAGADDVRALISALDDQDPLVRRDAATALGDLLILQDRMQKPTIDTAVLKDGIDALLALVAKEMDRGDRADPVVLKTTLEKSVHVVGKDQADRIRPLKPLLEDRDPETRRYTAFTMANAGGPDSVPAIGVLCELMRNDEEPALQESAAACLGRMGELALTAVPELTRGLAANRPAATRRASVVSLSQIIGRFERTMYEKKSYEEQQAVQTKLNDVGRPLVPELARTIKPRGTDETADDVAARVYAIETLAYLGSPANESALPEVVRLLGDTNQHPDVRLRCVWVFFKVNDIRAHNGAATLTKLLDETDPKLTYVRYEAARALAHRLKEQAPDKAADLLVEMLTAKVELNAGAQTNKTNTGSEGSQQTGTSTASRSAGDGRYLAANALGDMGARAKKPKVIEALKKAEMDSNERLSKSAARALDKIEGR
jgi:HEAT repeat protein